MSSNDIAFLVCLGTAIAATSCTLSRDCEGNRIRIDGHCVARDAGSRDARGSGDTSTDVPTRDSPPADACDASGPEDCNGLDDDCDGTIDETFTRSPVYLDADGDRHGDPATSIEACLPPEGYVTSSDDCDDSAPRRYPGLPELCNETDEDCDGAIDEGLTIPLPAEEQFVGDWGGTTPVMTVALAPFRDGYVALWTANDGRLRLKMLAPDGAELFGPGIQITDVGDAPEGAPHVRVIETAGIEYAVTTWIDRRGDVIVAAVELSTTLSAASMATYLGIGAGPRLAQVSDSDVAVTWIGTGVQAEVLDPRITLDPPSPVSVHTYSSMSGLPPATTAVVDAMGTYLLLAIPDGMIQLRRVILTPEVRSETRIATLDTSFVTDYAFLSAAPNAASTEPSVMAFFTRPGPLDEPEVAAARITPGAPGEEIGTEPPIPLARGRLVGAANIVIGGSADIIVANGVSTVRLAWAEVAMRDRSVTVPPMEFATVLSDPPYDVDVARRTTGEGGILYSIGLGEGIYAGRVYFVPLRCGL